MQQLIGREEMRGEKEAKKPKGKPRPIFRSAGNCPLLPHRPFTGNDKRARKAAHAVNDQILSKSMCWLQILYCATILCTILSCYLGVFVYFLPKVAECADSSRTFFYSLLKIECSAHSAAYSRFKVGRNWKRSTF